jgi:Family of unknown function (DUF6459)
MPQPPAGEWPSQFARNLAEALAGTRPARQVTTWTADHARQRIRRLGARELLAASRERQAHDIDREAE